MDNWFVLYVRTGSEKRVVKLLENHLPTGYKPFVPTKAFPLMRKGKVTKEIKLCFPGYVFIRSPNNATAFLVDTAVIIPNIKEAYYILYYGKDKNDVVMRLHERVYIERLMNADFCMDASLGVVENGEVRITEGVLVGLESKIKRFDHHKHLAVVEVETMGETREVSLMLELVARSGYEDKGLED